ncbi:GNAT family N-acetyltransferase [Nitrosopumilus sp.]|uniref:GNAT family N-acetyltransferase n=1 Tax=Nitrosopumilus sp. TaxID=2024843 RepID=UPI003B63A25F
MIRELRREDLWNGFLTTLDSLRKTSDIDGDKAYEVFDKLNSNQDCIVAVATIENEVVGTTTLIIEQEFIHNGGLVGHIEDVAVDTKHQGKGIGKKIMIYLLDYARKRGCYKTILDCIDDVKPFYEKMGFKFASNEMRFDYNVLVNNFICCSFLAFCLLV